MWNDFEQWQQLMPNENDVNSTVHLLPTDQQVIQWAKEL